MMHRIFPLLVVSFISQLCIVGSCEKANNAFQGRLPTSNVGAPRTGKESSLAPQDLGTSRLNRPRTWQDVSGYTPYEDYLPDQILVLFTDEIVLPEDFPQDSTLKSQPSFNPNSVLYQNQTHARFARWLAERYALQVLESQEAYVPGLNFCGYRLPSGVDPEAFMQRLLDENPKNIRLVEYNAIRKAMYTPNDPELSRQWFHTNIDSYSAWDYGIGSDETWIAVVDTGVDLDHPDLVDNILPVNAIWPDEDFDLASLDKVPEDTVGHGTHVAGIAAGVGDNGLGIAGVAYEARIIPIRILGGRLSWFSGLAGASATAMVLATELSYGGKTGADVINMSYGWVVPSVVELLSARYAYENGVVLVGAAGNESNDAQIIFPAGIPYVICAGATTKSDVKASYSNFGIWVDIAAPGGAGRGDANDIFSTYRFDDYAYSAGTSMATPMVAGAVALLKSVYPTLTPQEIRALLEASGIDLPDNQWGGNPLIRRLNVFESLNYTLSPPPSVEIVNPEDGAVVSGLTNVTYQVTDDAPPLISLFYVDGILVSHGDDAYEVDFTNFYPGEARLTIEVIDETYQHAFSEVTVIIPNPQSFPVPYYTGFDTVNDAEGWEVRDFSGPGLWGLFPDADGGYNLRIDYWDDDIDWLLTPNIDVTGYNSAKLVFKVQTDNTDDYIFVWLYPEIPTISENTVPLSLFNAVIGFPGYLELPVIFDGATTFKAGFIIGLLGSPDGTYLEIDDFYLTVPTALPSISILSPSDGERVSGTVPIIVNATDDWKVYKTTIKVEGTQVWESRSPPYSGSFNSANFYNGSAVISAYVYDLDFFDDNGDGSLFDSGTDEVNVIIQNQVISSFSPTRGFYGDLVNITGDDFNNYKPGATRRVAFRSADDEVDAPILSWTDTAISVTVPVGAVSGLIRVYLDASYAQSPSAFTVENPFDDLNFSFVDSPEDLMFVEDFEVSASPQPDLDSITLSIVGTDKTWTKFTRGDNSEQIFTVDISGLTTGAYVLRLTGRYKSYSDFVEKVFYLNTLPGDFNSDAVVDELDVDFLREYLFANGVLAEDTPAFLPFLDANLDRLITEDDCALVGYNFGQTLGTK